MNVFSKPAFVAFLLVVLAFPVFADDVVDISAGSAAELIDGDKGIVVLDIRTPKEFSEGHIEGAVNVDFRADDFEEKVAKLDPATKYVVHCQSGGRSGKSLSVFSKLKFEHLYHLKVGYSGWVDAGLPITK